MAKIELAPREALYPAPVVLVTCADRAKGRGNIITIAWCGVVCSAPPQIGISIRPSRYSHNLITLAQDFAVNIPTTAILEKTDRCGTISGRDIDKFAACSFTPLAASKITAPLIGECPVNIECTLTKVIPLGAHDLFVGTVVAVHADEAILDGRGTIDYRKAKPFVYNQGDYWDLGSKIGSYGFSR